MIRILLASTALAGLLATSAFAQDAAAPAAPPAGAAAADAGSLNFVRRLEVDQMLASDLTGASVYETVAPDARALGEIRNFVVGPGGKLAAVVIETSGLDQNKTVALPPEKVQWTADGDGKQRVVLRASSGELQAAPDFSQQSPQDAAKNGAAVPGSGAAGGPSDGTADKVADAPPASGTDVAGGKTTAPNAAPAPVGTGDNSNGYLTFLGNDQKLSQDVIGSNVYAGPGDDAPTIGSVNDLVITRRGEVPVAVVGVGGVLGIGEKNVGVPYGKLTIPPGGGGEPRLVMAASKEQLTAAPTFDEGDRTAQASSSGSAAQPVGSSAPADGGTTTTNADPATTASTGGTNDRSSLKPVAGGEMTAQNINGLAVYGPNDQRIGKVGDIALTPDGRVDAVVVDVGGFLGIGSKPVAVAMDNLQFMRDTNGTINIYTQFTQDQLKAAPGFDRETYAQNRGTMRLVPGSTPSPTDDSNSANTSGAGSSDK